MEIISKLLSSEARGELLVLFHLNPGLMETRAAVARRIGRASGDIREDIDELIELGVLSSKKVGTKELIFLNSDRDKEIQDLLEQHLRSMNSD